MKKMFKLVSLILSMAMIMALTGTSVSAASVTLSATTVIVGEGGSAQVKLLNASGKTKWTIGHSEVFSFKNHTVTGKHEGMATLYAENSNKKYKCKVIVVAGEVRKNSVTSLADNDERYVSFDVSGMDKVKLTISGSSYASAKVLGSTSDKVAVSIKGKNNGSGTAVLTAYDANDKNNKRVLTINVKGKDNGKAASSSQNKKPAASFTASSSDIIDEVIRLVNEERKAAGLSALEKDETLCADAQLRAKETAQLFSHTRPDGTKCFTAISIKYKSAAENIAKGYTSAEDVVDGWMNSSGHRKNILGSSYTKIGVGYDEASDCWVQLFTG